MTNGKTLCLNMIVRNEMANLERCLGAIADHIACWVIGDTGSTDGTQDFIRKFFAARNLPGELHSFPFHNFEQARNAALDCAYASPLGYDYLLLADADMELVVEGRSFHDRLEGPGYRLLQRVDSGLTYWNTRIVRRDAGARYHGVTDEYLDVPGGVKELQGVWYKDHASGSNRLDKFERDITLLSEALKQEPENYRYWFYLAQSYKDAGRTAEAAQAYAKRAGMGGWDEEAWTARLEEARCLRKLGDEGGFLRQALAAFNQRPQRAEPLYDLARFYREKGMNDTSVLFSEAGLVIPRPEQDILFLEDFVYTAGLQEEYSVAANYVRDPARKDRGFAACNWLALNREIPAGTRNLARSNLFFYLQPANAMMPSFIARPVEFTPPDGYRPSNPSVARLGNEIVLLQRAVNFTLAAEGTYRTPNDVPFHTRNFLLRLDADLAIQSSKEILPPLGMPKPAFQAVQGFEDARLFAWRNELWCIACVRELSPEGWCDQVLARIEDLVPGSCHLTDWRVLRPEGPRRHEKNWMPQVVDERLQFIYLCDPTRVVDEQARTVIETTPGIAAEQFRGGTQVIPFDGGWLSLIHETVEMKGLRKYQHRFVWFDTTLLLRSVSRPFFFSKKGVEFAAGLARHLDEKRLLISFGVDDRESWIATVDATEVRRVLLPTGSPTEGKLPTENRDQVLKKEAFIVREQQEIVTSSVPESGAFMKLLRTARQKEELGRSDDEVISAYMEASAACPTRAEALHGAARVCRNKGIHEQGYQFAAQGLAIAYPNDALFVEDWIYEYGLLDELAVHAYWTERYQESFEACQRLIREGKMPQDMYDRVKKNAEFAAEGIRLQSSQPTAEPIVKAPRSAWTPQVPSAGTELMVAGLRERMGEELERINLQVNHPGRDEADKRPRVVWMHHDVNQQWVQWCKDRKLVESVSCFVFISYWQRERYLNTFGLPPQRCVVLRYALDQSADPRRWEAGSIWRCAYTSTPFRGLSVLLDAWARLSPANAELHIWSSMRLYLADDGPYKHLYEQAEAMPGVIYHGIAPNPELRAALRSMHFLVYPSTFAETACLSVIEAMAAGCRVIIPSLGALPETTGGYARMYPSNPNAEEHATTFSENLAAEIATPWGGKPELSLSQQAHCAAVYDWSRRLCEWRELIDRLAIK